MARVVTAAAVAAMFVLGGASSASAAINFCHANGVGACNVDGENVHFGDDDGDDNEVLGWLQGGLIDVIYTASPTTELITTSQQGGGVAWVVPIDGLLTSLDVSLEAGYTFTGIRWRLDAPQPDGGRPVTWGITLHGYDATNTQFTQSYSGITQDEFFSIKATGGDRLTHIDFTTTSPVTATAQWEIGGVVPEPGAWALMIAGFGAAGAMIRRRRAIAA